MLPLHGYKDAVLEWLSKRGCGSLSPQVCAVFSESSFESGQAGLAEYFDSEAHISWIAGPGISRIDWPRNTSGDMLAHVATFCLSDAQLHPETRASWGDDLSLPSGFLEIYHDLQTYGYDAAGRNERGWLVRYIPDVTGLHLVNEAVGLDPVTGDECQQGLMMPGFTLPTFEDLPTNTAVSFDQWESCFEELKAGWHLQRFEVSADYQIPYSHLGGHSAHGKSAVFALLHEVLPLGDGDEHYLLASFESWTTLNGWFGDAGTLEVWISKQDLVQQRFDEAWCLIRND